MTLVTFFQRDKEAVLSFKEYTVLARDLSSVPEGEKRRQRRRRKKREFKCLSAEERLC